MTIDNEVGRIARRVLAQLHSSSYCILTYTTVDVEEKTLLGFPMQQKLKKFDDLLLAETSPGENEC